MSIKMENLYKSKKLGNRNRQSLDIDKNVAIIMNENKGASTSSSPWKAPLSTLHVVTGEKRAKLG